MAILDLLRPSLLSYLPLVVVCLRSDKKHARGPEVLAEIADLGRPLAVQRAIHDTQIKRAHAMSDTNR
jgi:hypothetical protein